MGINLDDLFNDIVGRVESFDLYSYGMKYNMFDTVREGSIATFKPKKTPTISFDKQMPQMVIYVNHDTILSKDITRHDDNIINVKGFTIIDISNIELIYVRVLYGGNESLLQYTNEGVFEKHVKLNRSKSQ